jgi:hypothetical protein
MAWPSAWPSIEGEPCWHVSGGSAAPWLPADLICCMGPHAPAAAQRISSSTRPPHPARRPLLCSWHASGRRGHLGLRHTRRGQSVAAPGKVTRGHSGWLPGMQPQPAPSPRTAARCPPPPPPASGHMRSARPRNPACRQTRLSCSPVKPEGAANGDAAAPAAASADAGEEAAAAGPRTAPPEDQQERTQQQKAEASTSGQQQAGAPAEARSPVTCVAWSRNGRQVAAGDADGTVALWDIVGGVKVSGALLAGWDGSHRKRPGRPASQQGHAWSTTSAGPALPLPGGGSAPPPVAPAAGLLRLPLPPLSRSRSRSRSRSHSRSHSRSPAPHHATPPPHRALLAGV